MANTDEAREALEALHRKVGEVTTSDEWRAWLDVLAKFHAYSPLNIMWMWAQWEARRADDPSLPEFSQPAAFSAWKDLGRYVRKGEKALSVLAPIIVADRENLGPDGKPRTKCVGFRVKRRTFDVSQTEGADLPENPAMPTLLTGEADPLLWAALVAHAESLGFSVEVRDHDGPENGWCNHLTREIVVKAGNDAVQRTKTLAHEVAHAILHGENAPQGMSRAEMEVEAESTAYVVAALLGFDTAAYSVSYIVVWNSRENHGECLTRTAERVIKCARAIAAAVAEHSTATAA
jgi:hypothetical protein